MTHFGSVSGHWAMCGENLDSSDDDIVDFTRPADAGKVNCRGCRKHIEKVKGNKWDANTSVTDAAKMSPRS